MPKVEFDFEDPLELNGVSILCDEDTTEPMTECFVEEFMRLGYNHKQILALFRNPHYQGMQLAFQKRGEPFVREKITEVFGRWGKEVVWKRGLSGTGPPGAETIPLKEPTPILSPTHGEKEKTTDPMGGPIPDLTI